MSGLIVDFSNVPSDVALVLAKNETTSELATRLSMSFDLDQPCSEMLHAVLIGAVAQAIDDFMGL